MQGIQWHGVKRRGAQSIMFLSSTKSNIHIPDDAIHVDLLSPNVSIMLYINAGENRTAINNGVY
jgi:hypothetical protein